MFDREIIGWKVNLKESKQTKEQNARLYYFIVEHCKAFSLHGETRTCSQGRGTFQIV